MDALETWGIFPRAQGNEEIDMLMTTHMGLSPRTRGKHVGQR